LFVDRTCSHCQYVAYYRSMLSSGMLPTMRFTLSTDVLITSGHRTDVGRHRLTWRHRWRHASSRQVNYTHQHIQSHSDTIRSTNKLCRLRQRQRSKTWSVPSSNISLRSDHISERTSQRITCNDQDEALPFQSGGSRSSSTCDVICSTSPAADDADWLLVDSLT